MNNLSFDLLFKIFLICFIFQISIIVIIIFLALLIFYAKDNYINFEKIKKRFSKNLLKM